jgi:hypothetical protein
MHAKCAYVFWFSVGMHFYTFFCKILIFTEFCEQSLVLLMPATAS